VASEGIGFTVDYDVIRNSMGVPFKYNMWQTPRQCGKSQLLEVFFNKKEKKMDKQEAAKELEVLRNKIKEIEEGLLKAEGRWRAGYSGDYWLVDDDGEAVSSEEVFADVDDNRYAAGNYFKSEEDAEASLIYKVLNDKWHYWVAGVNDKPDEVPEGCEYYNGVCWVKGIAPVSSWLGFNRRWPMK